MKKKFFAFSLALAILAGQFAPSIEVQAQRRRPVRRETSPVSSSFIASRFTQLADEYLRGYYAFNPTRATGLGLHDYDSQLESRSQESVAREIGRLRGTISALMRINSATLSADARLDYLVLLSHARSQLLDLQDIRMWQRDPSVYNQIASSSIDSILKRNYAPIEQRLTAVLARERQIARLLEEARANLVAPPRIYTEMAIAQVRGSIDYFTRVVPQMIERAGGASLNAARKIEFETANGNVISALRSFGDWMERDLLPRSTGSFSIGAENYRLKLLHGEMVDTPLAQLISEGERELRRTQEEMRELSEEITPGKGVRAALRALAREHPNAGGLVGDTRAELDRIRAFVRTQNILTMPASENLRVAETPEYARATSFASMDSPGAFERVATEAYYYVTPPPDNWDDRRKDEHLSFYNRYALPIISIHEVYPGHYYQKLALKRQPSRVRTVLSSASFTEGWAHYCEQMMLDEGFGGNNPRLRLAQLNMALLRLCRYLVGLRLHTQGMSYEEGVDFFMREGYQERVNAEREGRRGTQDPTYLVYTLGKMQIMKLREEYRQRAGASFNLGEFHDRLLSFGMPPVKIIRLAMLGETSGESGYVNEQPAQSNKIDFSVLATGYNSAYKGTRTLQLITNRDDWEEVWRSIGKGTAGLMPEVSFDTRAILVVYQGLKNTGGYAISVADIRREGMTIIVRASEQSPKPGDFVTEALTSPFVAVSIPRPPDGAIVKFEEEAKKLEQNRNVNPRTYPRKPKSRGRLRRRG